MGMNEQCLIGAGTPEGPCRLSISHTGPHMPGVPTPVPICGAPGPDHLRCRRAVNHHGFQHQDGSKVWSGATFASSAPQEAVDHPQHYGGKDNPYEAIKVINAWGLGFNLGNAVKYIARAGKKGDALTDLRKAAWYLRYQIELLEAEDAEV